MVNFLLSFGQHFSKVLVNFQLTFGQVLVNFWSTLINFWSTFSYLLVNFSVKCWSTISQLLVNYWLTFGQFSDIFWSTFQLTFGFSQLFGGQNWWIPLNIFSAVDSQCRLEDIWSCFGDFWALWPNFWPTSVLFGEHCLWKLSLV